jgi:hypothetical protein
MNAEQLREWVEENAETLFDRGSYGESGDSVSAVRLSSICELFAGKVLVPLKPDDLSNFIRSVDGNNSMGAGVLAEKICGWLAALEVQHERAIIDKGPTT